MMTWPLFKRLTPVLSALTRSAQTSSSSGDLKTILPNGGRPGAATGEWLDYGGIVIDEDLNLGFQYETSGGEAFVLCAALEYVGDNGAFQIAGDDSGYWTTPVDLVDGYTMLVPIVPDVLGDTFDLTFRALAVDAFTAKSGVINVYDRFDFGSGTAAPTRLLLTMSLSKTFAPLEWPGGP